MGQLKFHYNLIEYHSLIIEGIFWYRIVLTRVSTDFCIHLFVQLHVALNIDTLSRVSPKKFNDFEIKNVILSSENTLYGEGFIV